jgi:hypothetical protein
MTRTVPTTDVMTDEWVTGVVAAVERRGWSVKDAHESVITVQLGSRNAAVLAADSGSVLVIGWTERYGVDWRLSTDGATVAEPKPMTTDADPGTIAAAVDRLMLAGRSDARLVQHAMPAAAPSATCTCETVQPCCESSLTPPAATTERVARRRCGGPGRARSAPCCSRPPACIGPRPRPGTERHRGPHRRRARAAALPTGAYRRVLRAAGSAAVPPRTAAFGGLLVDRPASASHASCRSAWLAVAQCLNDDGGTEKAREKA